jgi:ATP-dependent Clp protease ATP-binding subunit ClpC
MTELSVGATLAWQIAAAEARAVNYQYIEKEHLMVGIFSLEKVLMLGPEESGLEPKAQQALLVELNALKDLLHGFGLNSTQLRRQLYKRLGEGNYKHTEKIIHRSEACKKIFHLAEGFVLFEGEMSCLHLLVAIMEDPGRLINEVLNEARVKPSDLRERALAHMAKAKKKGSGQEPLGVHHGDHKIDERGAHFLDRYGRDLTVEAREGKLGPFIGRRKEILQVIQTLARSSKNNPVLVGEAGVGKTAIVEALAVRVARGKDPHVLVGKRIIELNIGALVGGTKYRGEFEERLTYIIEEARTHPEVIIFVDEIHNVVGAGRGEGSMDAANLMKPALARGDLRCIGATTIAEYRRYIEQDSALERRFEKITVNEPSPEETVEILKGVRPKWEKHHHVRITDRALEVAVDLSIRFDGDHQLPDKAIDLVDKAGARTQVPILSMVPDEVRDKAKSAEAIGADNICAEVTDLTIAEVLSEKINVPLEIIIGHLEGMKKSRLLELESFLKKRLIGQNEAIERVCQRLLITHSGLSKRRGPLAVFLFLGPTGVGKTELVRLLAEFLFGSQSDMIRLDMSEYMEKNNGAKLIGSPPGYIGHEEEGQLTGKLRTKPHSVVLLDEIEKAHPSVFDLFLQVFDEGRLTDSKGRTADAKNAVFIMTSNIVADKDKHLGFKALDTTELETEALCNVKKWFRTEFINRIDELIVFQPLSEEDARKILKPMLDEICENLRRLHNITLHVGEEAERFLAHAGFSPRYGARELQRSVEQLVQVPLSLLILNGKLKKHAYWQVVHSDQGLTIIPSDIDKQ